jgi:putative copper resistance protein D
MGMGEMAGMGGMAGPIADRALCDGPLVAALLFVFGLALFMLKVAPPGAGAALDDHNPVFWQLLRLLAVVQLLLWPVKLLTNAASMAEVTLRQAIPLVPEVLRETHFGHDWLSTAPLALLLVVAAWIPGRASTRAGLLVLISAAMLVLWALSSHAIDFGPVAVAVYALHEAAAGMWAGSLLGLWLVAKRGGLDNLLVERIAQRVSRLSGWCVVVLVLSGAYVAYNTLGLNLDRVVYSAYGQTLLAKVSLFVLIASIGGYNRYRLVPAVGSASARHDLLRNVGVECLLMVGVLGLAALLANTPPAHHH